MRGELIACLLLCGGCGRVGFQPTAEADAGIRSPDAPLGDADIRLPVLPDSEGWLAFLHSQGQLLMYSSMSEWKGLEKALLSDMDATLFPKGSFGVTEIGGIRFENITNLEDVYFMTGVEIWGSDSTVSGPDISSLRGLESIKTINSAADIAVHNTASLAIDPSAMSSLEFIGWGGGFNSYAVVPDLSGTGTLTLTQLDSRGYSCFDMGRINIAGHSSQKLELATTGTVMEVLVHDGPLSDISGIAPGSSFCGLALPNNRISDISSLANITTPSLSLANNPLADISPLSSPTIATQLASLDLSGTQVTSLSALSGLTLLTTLNLGSTSVSSLAPIVNLPNLRALTLGEFAISQASLSSLASLPLTRLDGSLPWGGSQLSDLSPLAGITQIGVGADTTVDLSGNNLTSLAGLESVTSMATMVDLRSNPGLTNVDGLSSLQRLHGDGTLYLPEGLQDVSGLAQFIGESGSPDTLVVSAAASIQIKVPSSSPLCTGIDSGGVLLSGAVKADFCQP